MCEEEKVESEKKYFKSTRINDKVEKREMNKGE